MKYLVLKKRNLEAKVATTIFRLRNGVLYSYHYQKWIKETHYYPNDFEEITSETHLIVDETNELVAKDLRKKLFYDEILK